MFNPLKMMEMAGKAKEYQAQLEQRLQQVRVEGQSGGGAVTCAMNGKKQLLSIRIEPAAVSGLGANATDVEMLQDLIVAAVNDAGAKAETALKASVQGLLGGLDIPGLTS